MVAGSCRRHSVCPAYADYYAAKAKAKDQKKNKNIRKLRKKRDKGLFPKSMSEKYNMD